ncbi:MAG TPA: hypothetical protein VIX61_06080 [Casimicrobiaceae bacterium]
MSPITDDPDRVHLQEDAMKKSMLAMLLVATLAAPAAAQNAPGPDMIAITAGQAAQVNVANTGPASSPPCRVVIEFLDRDGNAIGGLRSGGIALASGTVTSAAIEHPTLRAGERFLVRVHVRKLESKASLNECDGVRASAEVFDTDTGKTTIFWKLEDG